jgi:hypothetical protein
MTGYERSKEDVNGRDNDFMIQFLSGLIRIFPTVYDTAKVSALFQLAKVKDRTPVSIRYVGMSKE